MTSRLVNNARLLRCAVLWWLACGIGFGPLALAATPPQKVLILYSWHDQMPWQAGVRAGITVYFAESRSATDFLHQHPELFRWGIADDKLPNPHTIIGRQASFWASHRWHIGSIVMLLALQFLLIVPLLRSRALHRRALAALVDERARLEQHVVERTAELTKSQSHYRRIAATIPAMLYDYVLHADGSSQFLYVGPKCCDLFELNESDLLADAGAFWRLVHPDDLLRLKEEDATANRTSETFSAEVRIVTRSGRLKWIQLSSQANAAPPGEPAVWSGLMLDISERKESEAELEQSRVHLQSSIELLRHVTAQVPGMVYQYRLRPDGRSCFPYASAGIRDIYGLTADEVREDAAQVFAVLHPDDR
jgi:PAS domain S-box-containing protein